MAAKNKWFAKYGHVCEVTSPRDDFPMFRRDGNIISQIWKVVTRSRMISEVNNRAIMFLHSQKAIENEICRHMKYLYIIHPFSIVRKYWEAFMVCTLMLIFVIIPLDVASGTFPLENNLNNCFTWKILRTIFDLVCLGDVVINFVTGYCDEEKHEVVLHPKKIALHYGFTFFIPDLVSSIPEHIDMLTGMIVHPRVVNTLRFLACLKFLRFFTFMRYMENTNEAFNLNITRFKCFMVLYGYMLMFHALTCLNMIIYGCTDEKELKNVKFVGNRVIWKDSDNNTIDFLRGYFTILRGTSYLACHSYAKDQVLLSSWRRYHVVIWIISKLAYFHLIAKLMELVMTKRSSTRKYTEMVRELREYMRHKQLPEMLQNRLLGYYEFRFQKSYFRESEIFNLISGQLKQDLVMHSCRKLVENVQFFQNLPLPLIIRIVSALITEVFLVNDVIIKVGTHGDCMYFIASGSVAVYTKSGHEVKHLDDGDYFGEVSLIYRNTPRESSIVAIETCELYRLDREHFVKAIMPYPDLMDKITKHAIDRLEVTQYLEKRALFMTQN